MDEPVRLDIFMADAVSAYYARRDPFGREGDFITAPEISQVFGELIGAWVAHVWMQMGSPASFHLVELGPGRGTLMQDALRATAKIEGFHSALSLHLVETSPVLREQQRHKLSSYNPHWHADIESLPAEGPMIFIANEFFDALPIRQFEMTKDGWKERFVHSHNWYLSPSADFEPPAEASIGSIFEICPLGSEITAWMAQRIVRNNGAALVIDYGYEGPAYGDTLQALQQHQFCDPLQNTGQADITAHVDFTALVHAARAAGCKICGPVEQGGFLTLLGARQRALALKNARVLEDVERLILPEQMGRLFKVLAFVAPNQPVPEGFA